MQVHVNFVVLVALVALSLSISHAAEARQGSSGDLQRRQNQGSQAKNLLDDEGYSGDEDSGHSNAASFGNGGSGHPSRQIHPHGVVSRRSFHQQGAAVARRSLAVSPDEGHKLLLTRRQTTPVKQQLNYAPVCATDAHSGASPLSSASSNGKTPSSKRAASSGGSKGEPGTDIVDFCLDTSSVKTLVNFGDSWTSCDQNNGQPCSTPSAFTVSKSSGIDKDFKASGRVSNGENYIDRFAKSLGAKLINFGLAGATVDRNILATQPVTNDLGSQFEKFKEANVQADPATTLCTFAFGINDSSQAAKKGGGKEGQDKLLQQAAAKEVSYLAQLKKTCGQTLFLDANGSSFGAALREEVTRLGRAGQKVAYVGFRNLLNDMETNYKAYGFTSTDACVKPTSGGNHYQLSCKPDQVDSTLNYFQGHPSAMAHAELAAFLLEGLAKCGKSSGNCKATPAH
ncbi:hypothetical protein ACQY0O_005547 [Thecaphora frezii]